MKTFVPIALLLIAALSSVAQEASPPSPGLQPRSNNPSEDRPVVVLKNNAKRVLPDDASGLYLFEEPGVGKGTNFGEGIQLNEQFGDVTGYLTAKAAAEHNKIASYFLNRIEGGGGELSFTTKAVHGVWYSFDGKVVRGGGATPSDSGYYMLDGALITHDDLKHTTQQRAVNLNRTGMRSTP
jgi:hypothetical protein